MSVRGLLAMGGLCVAAGCSQPESAHPVSWYLKHPGEMSTKVAWCADDAGRRATDDCQNALTANAQKAAGTMKELPPIDWNKKP